MMSRTNELHCSRRSALGQNATSANELACRLSLPTNWLPCYLISSTWTLAVSAAGFDLMANGDAAAAGKLSRSLAGQFLLLRQNLSQHSSAQFSPHQQQQQHKSLLASRIEDLLDQVFQFSPDQRTRTNYLKTQVINIRFVC